jgi:PKD repeat protein
VPLTVTFDGSRSTDADGDPLTYEWAFGDGSPNATGVNVMHTYGSAGRFTATLTVRDGLGGTGTATATIQAGNTPPTASITSPTAATRFAVGQTLTLTGAASDAEDGTLGAASLSWTVLLHHNTHTHPYYGPATGNNLAVQAPAPEDLAAAANSFLEIYLTATDSAGAAHTVRLDVQPQQVQINLATNPSGRTLGVNGTSLVAPATLTSWAGYTLNLSAPTQQDAAGQTWVFTAWSDGGAASHPVVTPAAPATYTATFATSGTAATFPAVADTYVRSGTYANQNFGTAPTLVVKHSTWLNDQRETFVRFSIGAGTVRRAVLRFQGNTNTGGAVPCAVHPVASTTWSETALTWNTRPPRGTSALAAATISGTTPMWYELDVTAYVSAERAAGRTAVSFVLVATSPTTAYATFTSRKSSSRAPQLVITP